jgi:N-acyl-D-amino-acid deacylase
MSCTPAIRKGLPCLFVPFLICLATPQVGAAKGPDPVRTAIKRSLKRLQQGSTAYTENRRCFSCHHQTLAILPLVAARRRGFRIDPDHLKQQVAFTVESFSVKETLRKGKDIAISPSTASYALLTLEAAGHPADATTAALVEYLLQKQSKDGSWFLRSWRPPSGASLFTPTALALRGLRVYGPARGTRDKADLRARITKAREKGLAWLRKATPTTTEDKVFRLRGLVWGGAPRKEIEAARSALLKEQRRDGSWSQLPNMAGDAYATGTALTALRSAGLPATEAAYQKGVKYLLRTQRTDGAWIVQTRSKPVQKYFDNGDPGGKSQFISFAATGWATLALLETLPIE